MEIERKFLVKEVPKYTSASVIRQGYLCLGDKEEVRIRSSTTAGHTDYYLTAKRGTGMIRGEWEIEITEKTFDHLWLATEERRIKKTRAYIQNSGIVITVDIYTEFLNGLLIAEIEFPSEQDALSFTPPSWFGEEVTHDERYKNRSLAVNGLPQ